MATQNSSLDNPIFHDADKAREHLERIRWPDGPFCPHCGESEAYTRLEGAKHRPGVHQCNSCRKQFTVTVGTVFERSKVPLNKWLLATYLICSSKKGISSHQLHRTLGVTYKTAWFMTHRIREAMKEPEGVMGSGGGVIEADESYIGRKKGVSKKRAGSGHKQQVFALVERGGKVRSKHIAGKMFDSVKEILNGLPTDANLMTDDARMYKNIGKRFASHQAVNHSAKEYVRGNAHTNTIEGYFSIFKRGMKGVYQHCTEDHLQRYLSEFDFRYNYRVKLGYTDMERADIALSGITGKRLTYRRPDGAYA
jgi:transposase-like protein